MITRMPLLTLPSHFARLASPRRSTQVSPRTSTNTMSTLSLIERSRTAFRNLTTLADSLEFHGLQ
jgi:hypothetical protein